MARTQRDVAISQRADLRRDRIAFVLLAFVLTAFGLLMVYSSSSIMALTSEASHHNAGYYAQRQLVFAALGVVLAAIAALADYHLWSQTLLVPICFASIGLLGLVLSPLAGQDAYGATRWIAVGPIHLQPSEFSKAAIVLAAADLAERYLAGEEADHLGFLMRCFVLVGLPLLLIIAQPDKGTVIVCGLAVITMLVVAGAPLRYVLPVLAGGLVGIAALSLRDTYSRTRIMTMLNPWRDPYDAGYQLLQGWFAFGSGGLFGVGLGMSRQKYSYLPMAHNDFIFAVIGEELGLVGTLAVLLAFFLLVWLGFRIARSAPDLSGTLIASGCVSLLGIQLLVNVCGVLGIIPLSGKPIPFLSYGGSSIMSTLLLVGLVLSVARASEAAGAASGFVVHEGGARQRGLRLVEGGAQATPDELRAERALLTGHAGGRVSRNANGTRRIDLGPSATDRLRGRDRRG